MCNAKVSNFDFETKILPRVDPHNWQQGVLEGVRLGMPNFYAHRMLLPAFSFLEAWTLLAMSLTRK